MPNPNLENPRELNETAKERATPGTEAQDSANMSGTLSQNEPSAQEGQSAEGRPYERQKGPGRSGARGTAAMDPETRQEVARKGGLAVSRNKEHMASIGRKGGQSVSRNREHMAAIGRKGGSASRGTRSGTS